MATSREMTEGRALPLIFNFTLPLLLGNLLQQTYSLVDAAIVGRFLGINALASVGASTSVVFLILGFCNGCCGGFGIPVAQKFGARDYVTMRRYVAVSLQLAAVMSVVIAVVTSIYCADILHMMSTPENIFTGAYYYLLVTFIGVPFTFFYNLLSSIIRALGDSKTPFWFLLLSTVLNILLDLFCILVLGWGVAGAAIATVFSQGVSAILCYIYMMRRFDILKTTPAERKFDGALARTLMYIGVPMGLQFSITAIGSIMLQSANNALGTACVAAFTAAMRIKMFFMCPFESLGMAMATYSGQNYGAGKPERIWMGVKASALMMIVYWAFTFCVLMFGARTFALLFVDASELEILKNTELFLHISVSFFPVLGLLCILQYTIQGVGYTNLAMLSGVSEMIAQELITNSVSTEAKRLAAMSPIVAYIQPPVEIVKERSEQYEAHLDFPVSKSVILTDFMNNHQELMNIRSMFGKVQNDRNLTITGISIEGFASPEGPLKFNEQLSQKRAEALKAYLTANEKVPANLYKVSFGGENWDGLIKALETSSMKDKETFIHIIKNTGDDALRKKEIMHVGGGTPYRTMLKEIYPGLRKVNCKIDYTVVNFDVEQGRIIIRENPKYLSLNEMYQVANSYPKGSKAR